VFEIVMHSSSPQARSRLYGNQYSDTHRFLADGAEKRDQGFNGADNPLKTTNKSEGELLEDETSTKKMQLESQTH
jgi:hypothetical protein